MQRYTLALLAAAVQAEYQTFQVNVDDVSADKYFKSRYWSTATANGSSINISSNNNLYIKDEPWDGQDFSWMPSLLGGAVIFTVDLSQVGCGCVSGVYAVERNSQCNEQAFTGSNPQCQSVDIMQANPFGFLTTANPCSNGTCDAVSQCQYNTAQVIKDNYGEDAYGPGGTMIDTDNPFQVKTAFLSRNSSTELYALSTELSQDGQTILYTVECPDYIAALSDTLDGGVGFILSHWDNRDGSNTSAANLETTGTCATPAESCDGASTTISDFRVETVGYNEETEPESLTWHPFIAETDLYSEAHEYYQFYAKGKEGLELTANNFDISIGQSNRAGLYSYPEDAWPYQHWYLAGTVEFDVDVSEVGCGCAASVSLMAIDNETCDWDTYTRGAAVSCPMVELMDANTNGFNTAAHPCEFGECDAQSQCTRRASDNSASAYGPGSSYTIDTTRAYNVKTEFWSDVVYVEEMEEYLPTDLTNIKTTLMQDGQSVELNMDCSEYLYPLSYELYNLSMTISTEAISGANDIDQSCSAVCDDSNVTVSNVKWTTDNAMNDPPTPEPEPERELIVGGFAPTLDSGDCALKTCSECREAWYSDETSNIFYTCTDETVYKYTNICPSWMEGDAKCMTDADKPCFRSFPIDDEAKWQSVDFACRTVPDTHITDIVSGWQKANRLCDSTKGLCHYGCGDGACHNSWPEGDAMKWSSNFAMCRCLPA